MKYFIRKSENSLLSSQTLDVGVAYELTSEKALFWYRLIGKTVRNGGENLVVQPWYRKGTPMKANGYEVWGENISNKELFRRRIAGEVAKEVINE